jgi:hypothetical protein
MKVIIKTKGSCIESVTVDGIEVPLKDVKVI